MRGRPQGTARQGSLEAERCTYTKTVVEETNSDTEPEMETGRPNGKFLGAYVPTAGITHLLPSWAPNFDHSTMTQ